MAIYNRAFMSDLGRQVPVLHGEEFQVSIGLVKA